MLTFDQIKELIELVATHRLSGIEMERSGFRLKVDGEAVAPPAVVMAPAPEVAQAPPVAVAAAAPAAAAPAAAAPAEQAAAPAEDDSDGVPEGAQVMTSPIVGTFYRRPNPDSPPFAEVGQRVSQGDVLCIVEAMKLMNEIESDIDGEIVKIYPKNAQPVEFGEPLFAIRPS